MNINKICVFPDTMLRDEIIFPLVQVFDQVVHLRPVENDIPSLKGCSSLCQQAITDHLVDFCCPAPLGDDRDRFLHLVNDLQQRPDDYAGQLTNLSLAGLGRKKDLESKSTIISTLLKQNGLNHLDHEQREMVLWQARLVLTLGEVFDREQAELQQNLDRLTRREQGLISELREDNQQPFLLTRQLTAENSATNNQLRLRLKAWSRLFGLGSEKLETSLFVTPCQDAFDLLADHCESAYKQTPEKLFELPLALAGDDSSAMEKCQDFINAAGGRENIQKSLFNSPASQAKGQETTVLESWQHTLEKHFPTDQFGQCTLSLYAFTAAPPQKLFLESFGRDEDDMQLDPQLASSSTSTLIGLLHEKYS